MDSHVGPLAMMLVLVLLVIVIIAKPLNARFSMDHRPSDCRLWFCFFGVLFYANCRTVEVEVEAGFHVRVPL